MKILWRYNFNLFVNFLEILVDVDEESKMQILLFFVYLYKCLKNGFFSLNLVHYFQELKHNWSCGYCCCPFLKKQKWCSKESFYLSLYSQHTSFPHDTTASRSTSSYDANSLVKSNPLWRIPEWDFDQNICSLPMFVILSICLSLIDLFIIKKISWFFSSWILQLIVNSLFVKWIQYL